MEQNPAPTEKPRQQPRMYENVCSMKDTWSILHFYILIAQSSNLCLLEHIGSEEKYGVVEKELQRKEQEVAGKIRPDFAASNLAV